MAPIARTVCDRETGETRREICMNGSWTPVRMLDDLSLVPDKNVMSAPILAKDCRLAMDRITIQYMDDRAEAQTDGSGVLARLGEVPTLLSLALCAPKAIRPEVHTLMRSELTCKVDSVDLQVARIMYESLTTYMNVHPRPAWVVQVLAAIKDEPAYNIRQNLLYYAGVLAERSRPTQADYLRELANPSGASSTDEERPAPDDEPAAKRYRRD